MSLRIYELTLLFLVIFCTGQCASHGDTFKNGQYRILSLEDGLYLSAGAPTFLNKMELGEIATEKWGNFREQRWDLISQTNKIDPTSPYWILSQDNVMNRLSAVESSVKPMPNFIQLVYIGIGQDKYDIFQIKSTTRDACIVNPGYGKKVLYAICNANARNQHWVFDFLGK